MALPKIAPIAPSLLNWFYENKRVLPFREDPSPYHIWVSEIMLQQTRVSAALPYYERFVKELPTITSLALCEEEKLHKLWQGLGYYSRVRNLQKAAKIVVEEYGGELPADYALLKKLPGIGDYTAGAISSIAFGLPEVAVDGNVLRVFSRLLASNADIMLPQTKKDLSKYVQEQQPREAPGDYNEALMELGALICTPGTPSCEVCPLQEICVAKKKGIADQLPVKAEAKPKVVVPVCVVVIHNGDSTLLLQRPKTGLLAGLWGPFTEEGAYSEEEILGILQKKFGQIEITGVLPKAEHVFTHKIWKLYGWECTCSVLKSMPKGAIWTSGKEIKETYSVPNAFKTYLPFMVK